MSQVIFITGPSGSGKSTVAAKVAELWPATCVLLDFDKQRTFIKSGYAEPSYGWSDECERQWKLAREVITAMVPVYAAENVDIVIEAYANTGDYDLWLKVFGAIPYKTFVLMPSLEQALARNNQRSGAAKLTKKDITGHHEEAASWKAQDGVTLIEDLTKSPEEIARSIILAAKV